MANGYRLQDEIQYVKGVGPRRAELFARIGIRTVGDLIEYLPRDYLDLRQVTPIAHLTETEAIVRATVTWATSRITRRGIPVLEATVEDETGELAVVWFHRADLAQTVMVDARVQLTGKPKCVDTIWRMTNPKMILLEESEDAPGIVSVYSSTSWMTAGEIRRIVQHAVERAVDQIPDPLPEAFRRERSLPSRAEAFRVAHLPADLDELKRARDRLAYDEFLCQQIELAMRREAFRRQEGVKIEVSAEVDRRIRRLFPYALTPAQDQAIAEIVVDLRGPSPMRRLLQGDVGSGKTAVAIYAILATVAAGMQAVFLAPTEILARQQFAAIDEYLQNSRVTRRLFTGSIQPAERRTLLEKLALGEIDLVVGTHALIQKDVVFRRLGLVVVDEQHKFGVRQRAELIDARPTPHQLVMTATPLPRSLSMTWFGDLSVSTINARPEGFGQVKTHVVPSAKRQQAYEFIAGRARLGQKSIIVCPRIQGDQQVRGAVDVYEEMKGSLFAELPFAVIHGKLEEEEKAEIIRRFRKGDILILISTVVVEVGLDVPDAAIILIEHAERFGLNQLHQMRGRVGRGGTKGLCFFLAYSDDPKDAERLQSAADTNDGFALSELDAQLRGIGELLGEKQHGHWKLRFGDFVRDRDVLLRARQDAETILRADPTLSDPSWARVRSLIESHYGSAGQVPITG